MKITSELKPYGSSQSSFYKEIVQLEDGSCILFYSLV